jgi:hypothetical protein
VSYRSENFDGFLSNLRDFPLLWISELLGKMRKLYQSLKLS